MITYADKERAQYWPVSVELLAQYNDGSHTRKDMYGNLIWYQNGLLHRDDDKPAWFGTNGGLAWWKNGQRHRINGPAVIYPNEKLEWWINAKNITHEVNEWLNGEEWLGTSEQIVEFQLRFC